MNMVKNIAKLINTILGGVVCVPKAVLKNDRTTTMRVKLVTITSIDGASDRTVIKRMVWTMRADADGPDPMSKFMDCANAAHGAKDMTTRKSRKATVFHAIGVDGFALLKSFMVLLVFCRG